MRSLGIAKTTKFSVEIKCGDCENTFSEVFNDDRKTDNLKSVGYKYITKRRGGRNVGWICRDCARKRRIDQKKKEDLKESKRLLGRMAAVKEKKKRAEVVAVFVAGRSVRQTATFLNVKQTVVEECIREFVSGNRLYQALHRIPDAPDEESC